MAPSGLGICSATETSAPLPRPPLSPSPPLPSTHPPKSSVHPLSTPSTSTSGPCKLANCSISYQGMKDPSPRLPSLPTVQRSPQALGIILSAFGQYLPARRRLSHSH